MNDAITLSQTIREVKCEKSCWGSIG